MAKRSTMVGLDVHKESIDASVAEEGAPGRCVTTRRSRAICDRSMRWGPW